MFIVTLCVKEITSIVYTLVSALTERPELSYNVFLLLLKFYMRITEVAAILFSILTNFCFLYFHVNHASSVLWAPHSLLKYRIPSTQGCFYLPVLPASVS